ncbi:transporter [Thalassomonas actiniarum]|uniref:Transporter n=1 Tax=Thalassomonas actiniarum TaxID=485447 RepID=A0AAF0C4R5_9GAMM|nr:transporter [Thalassomonas actiniarum]WDE00105.1 transporter [Thalassomonas actiniarum]
MKKNLIQANIKAKAFTLSLAMAAFLPATSYGHGTGHANFSSQPDAHAPIGVMADHMHKTGEWMLSYRYMHMDMNGLLRGSKSLSAGDYNANTDFMVRPKEMTMKMHMLGLMYAPSDNITLMAMAPWLDNEMDLAMSGMSMGSDNMHSDNMHSGAMTSGSMTESNFSTDASGLGDITLGALIKLPWPGSLLNSRHQRLHANVTFTLPTADSSERDTTPMSENALLPYGMQTGFDTWQLETGITYGGNQARGNFSWGAQLLWKTALENNNQGYKPGNQLTLNSWLAYRLSHQLSFSLRLNHIDKDAIEGSDKRINPMMAATAVPANYEQEKTSLFLGANYLFTEGNLKGHRLAAEIGRDIDEDYAGIGMDSGTVFILGWQKAF